MSTIGELIREGAKRLSSSPSPLLDSEVLFRSASGLSKIECISKGESSVEGGIEATFLSFIARRAAYEPVAYITGVKEFWGLDFCVTPDVLIPRPDTEIVVEEALKIIDSSKLEPALIDIGTGSGCIAISIAYELKRKGISLSMIATDTSNSALEIAKQNAVRHGVHEHISFLHGEYFAGKKGPFDLILSNPPYVAEGDLRVSPETRFEPKQALYAGMNGFECHEAIIEAGRSLLQHDGCFLLEIGAGQECEFDRFSQGFTITKVKDLAEIDRVVKLEWRGSHE